jgi:hypothetical protein
MYVLFFGEKRGNFLTEEPLSTTLPKWKARKQKHQPSQKRKSEQLAIQLALC